MALNGKGEKMAAEARVSVRQISDSACECLARDFKINCDRPESKGGGNAGPMGGEIFLIGLGGCFMSNLLAAIKAREAKIRDVEIAITGVQDGTPTHFTKISMRVSAQAGDQAELEKMIVIAERSCIVANTLKNAVQLSIEVA
jgi:putative redox protein